MGGPEAGDTGVVPGQEIQGCRGGPVFGDKVIQGGLTVQSGVLRDVRVLTLMGASRVRGVIQGFNRGKLYRCGCNPNVNSGMFTRVTQRCNTDRSR